MTHNYYLRPRRLTFLEKPGTGDDNGFQLSKNVSWEDERSELPTPDENFIKYWGDADKYLNTGKRDADLLRAALIRAGVDDIKGPGNFLELGCANSRVLRWFADWASYGEGWGVDLNAAMIFWCHQNLSPPFHYNVSTTLPKLSFADHYFSLVFALSVFTHIDDMYLSWLCEMRRILKPGGLFYFTIHDEAAADIETEMGAWPQKRRVQSQAYNEFVAQESDFCTVNRDWRCLSSFRRDYLVDHLSNFFDVIELVSRAMGQTQTGILLRRK